MRRATKAVAVLAILGLVVFLLLGLLRPTGIAPGTKVSYIEYVSFSGLTWESRFNLTVLKIQGQNIYVLYQLVESKNSTLQTPQNFTYVTGTFNPAVSSTYAQVFPLGLPVFATVGRTSSGHMVVQINGTAYNVSYAEQETSIHFNLTYSSGTSGQVELSFSGNYTKQGILSSCNVRSSALGQEIEERCVLERYEAQTSPPSLVLGFLQLNSFIWFHLGLSMGEDLDLA